MGANINVIADEIGVAVKESLRASIKIDINDLMNKDGRSFFKHLEGIYKKYNESSDITKIFKDLEDKKIQEILQQTLISLKSQKHDECRLYQRIEAFEKEYADSIVLTSFQKMLNEQELIDLKTTIGFVRLKYSQYSQGIESLKKFVIEYDYNRKYREIPHALGIIRLLVMAVDQGRADIVESLLKFPKEVMQNIFEEIIESFQLREAILKGPYFFTNASHHFCESFVLVNDVYDFVNIFSVNYPIAFRRDTLFSLALRKCVKGDGEYRILELLLNASLKENVDFNFSFSRSCNLEQGGVAYNYLHDLIEGLCLVNERNHNQSIYSAHLACRALDALISRGFNAINLNNKGENSPFSCLISGLEKVSMPSVVFSFIVKHLIKVAYINYKIRSTAIIEDSTSNAQYASPFIVALIGDVVYGSRDAVTRIHNFMQLEQVSFDFLLQDISQALLTEFEALVPLVRPANPSPNIDSFQNDHLRVRWCKTVKQYTWSSSSLKIDSTSLNSVLKNDMEEIIVANQEELTSADFKVLKEKCTSQAVVIPKNYRGNICMTISHNGKKMLPLIEKNSKNAYPGSLAQQRVTDNWGAQERVEHPLQAEEYIQPLFRYYLHCPRLRSIKESTITGYYFNMDHYFPLNIYEIQTIVGEYLDFSVIESTNKPIKEQESSKGGNDIKKKTDMTVLLAFNRGRDAAKFMATSPNMTHAQMEATLNALVKADPFDQVALCKLK